MGVVIGVRDLHEILKMSSFWVQMISRGGGRGMRGGGEGVRVIGVYKISVFWKVIMTNREGVRNVHK